MSSSKAGAAAVDEARHEICRRFAEMLNAGAYRVRVRLSERDGKGAEAWFYMHRNNAWTKAPGAVAAPSLVAAIEEEMDLLASKQHGDECSTRQNKSADWKETDVRFHRDKLEPRLGKNLESYLMGVLFRDEHASKKDRRRPILRGGRRMGAKKK
jgi:hypothetical protein